MDTYDVVVVGGGPAGSSCAGNLIRAGWSVLVLDKSTYPRDKPCAGWITPQIIEALQIQEQEYRPDRVWQPIYGFRCGLIGGDEVEVPYAHPISYGIRRCEFDTFLLGRSGADTRLGEPVKAIEYRQNQWIINDRFRTPMLVGAGGHFCPVARQLGARNSPSAAVVTAQEVEFWASDEELAAGRVRAEVPELFFCPDLKGYGWCFRKGNYLNIGLGRLDTTRLSGHVARFCEYLRERQKVVAKLPHRFRGHAYQLYDRIQPKLFDDGVVLIGDSAGLAYTYSGEGIRPAVESGLLAADTILNAAGSFRRQDLARYQDSIIGRFGKPRSLNLSGWLPAAWLHYLASHLLVTQWFCRRVVMDSWFLHTNQGPLKPPLETGR